MLIRIHDSDEAAVVVESEAAPAFFAGDLRALSVADVLALLNTGRKSGRLLLEMPDGIRKTLFLTEGEIGFASSTAPGDRIGEVLWRGGVITHEQLEKTGAEVEGGKKFGEMLIEAGIMTPADLYQGLVMQVLDITLSFFSCAEGRFLFVAGENEDVDRVQLEQTTHDLILAGLRRLDDLEHLRSVVPPHVVYERRSAPTGMSLTEHERVVWELIDGVRTAAEILGENQLGEQEGLQNLHNLAEARLIVPRKAAAAAAARLDAGAEPAPLGEVDGLGESAADLFEDSGALFDGDEDWLSDAGGDSGSAPLDLGSQTAESHAEESAIPGEEAERPVGGLEEMLEPGAEAGEGDDGAAELSETDGEDAEESEPPPTDAMSGEGAISRPPPQPETEAVDSASEKSEEAGESKRADEVEAEEAARSGGSEDAEKAAEAQEAGPKEAEEAGKAAKPADETKEAEVCAPAPADPEAESMPFAAYSKVSARIYAILAKARRNPDELNTYFEKPPEAYAPLFEGVRFHGGKLDMSSILVNARRIHGDHYKGRALEALEAFQSFALFQAKNALPSEVASKVQRLVMLIHLGKA